MKILKVNMVHLKIEVNNHQVCILSNLSKSKIMHMRLILTSTKLNCLRTILKMEI